MSFKEIKNLLRMVNVDMNDMYAYRLFKVGTCYQSDLCPPSRGSPQFPRPTPTPGFCGEWPLSAERLHLGLTLPFHPGKPLSQVASLGPQPLPHPQAEPR